jgi:hypothetical protein
MTAQMDALEARLAGGRKRKAAWAPPEVGDFAQEVQVLACDGSLGNFGWVRAVVMPFHGACVLAKGTIRPVTVEQGYLGTWDRAIQLERELSELGTEFALADRIAVEAPMVKGGHRTESSLIAGLMAWRVALPHKRLDVGATHVSSVLLGDYRVSQDRRKNAIKAAVARYIPGSERRDWNEHERDAAAIALTVLWDLAHR